MPIRAKFRCIEKTSRTSTAGYGEPKPVDTEEATLVAVQGDENKEWSRWTPSGSLKMQITNPAAIEQLVVGKDYFIDVTPVEA